MNYVLFDTESIQSLYPFTLTRSAAQIPTGLMTNAERLHMYTGTKPQILSVGVLQELYEYTPSATATIYVNAALIIDEAFVTAMESMALGTVLVDEHQQILTFKTDVIISDIKALYTLMHQSEKSTYSATVPTLKHPWDIFSINGVNIISDFSTYTKDKTSQPIPEYVTVIGDPYQIFIEDGAKLMPCMLNTLEGPIYIGTNAEIMEACVVRGPFALLAGAALKIGTKAYTNSTIGRGSKVGGEISNVVFFDNSNKGHDGFLGNAVIGEWCNLGADTNSSNLKNNYSLVKVWSMEQNRMVDTHLQFCGLLMGDHSKCGINTMFNTGTVVGVSANIFGAGFPDKYIPSFTWGAVESSEVFAFDKALEVANAMMGRRKKALTIAETNILQHAFNNREQ